MRFLISQIQSSVDSVGMDATRLRFATRRNVLAMQIRNLPSTAKKRDWTTSQQTAWVKAESLRLTANLATLDTVIARFLP